MLFRSVTVQPAEVAALLDAERSRSLARLEILTREHRGFVDASRDTNADDEHDPEGTTIAFERSQVDALLQQARERLGEVDAAEQRLADATYGGCETCGEPIADARLEARPTATRCIVHA